MWWRRFADVGSILQQFSAVLSRLRFYPLIHCSRQILEEAWGLLQQALAAAVGVEDLRHAHARYMQRILSRSPLFAFVSLSLTLPVFLHSSLSRLSLPGFVSFLAIALSDCL